MSDTPSFSLVRLLGAVTSLTHHSTLPQSTFTLGMHLKGTFVFVNVHVGQGGQKRLLDQHVRAGDILEVEGRLACNSRNELHVVGQQIHKKPKKLHPTREAPNSQQVVDEGEAKVHIKGVLQPGKPPKVYLRKKSLGRSKNKNKIFQQELTIELHIDTPLPAFSTVAAEGELHSTHHWTPRGHFTTLVVHNPTVNLLEVNPHDPED